MAIPLDDYKKINSQMPKRGKGDQIDLSKEDEMALDKAWEKDKPKAEKSKPAFAWRVLKQLCK